VRRPVGYGAFSYFSASIPAFATCPSCGALPPETPTAPMILPSTTMGIPPSITALVLAAGAAGAQAPPPYGPPITLEQAKKVIAGAEAESKKNNWSMVITVLDAGGNVVLMARMDGAQLGSNAGTSPTVPL